MYAVIKAGGRQYRVAPGAIIQIDKIEGSKGDEISIDDVLFVSNGDNFDFGAPLIEGASVKARVLRQGKGPKVDGYKFKRRKGESKQWGHRQPFTEVLVTSVSKNGQEISE